MKQELTLTLVRGIIRAFKENTLDVFKRAMQNRRIPETLWRPVIEKDEDVLIEIIYGSDKTDKFTSLRNPKEGKVQQIMPKSTDQWIERKNKYTSGEREFYWRWG